MRIHDTKSKVLPSWQPMAHRDQLTADPVQEPPVSFGVLDETMGQPGPAAEPATQPLRSFGHSFGNIAITAPSPATPVQAAPTPAQAPAPGPASPAAKTKFPIKSSFTVTDKIERKGPAPAGFGLTSPNVLRTFASTNHVNGVWETPVSLHIAVPWQVGSGGRTDIPSQEAVAITQKNYQTVVDDLTPPAKSGVVGGLNLHAGQPPRTQFWAEDLTIKHEEFHADEDVKFGREGADQAQKWLDTQTAQDADEVGTHLDKVPGMAAKWIDTKMAKPASELRAYADGAPEYQARVDAIQSLGDSKGYRAGARRRRARKAGDDS